MEITLQTYFFELIHNPVLIIVSSLVIGLMISNGMTDARSDVATCISTRAITPKKAIIMATFANSLGLILMSLLSSNVAATIINMANFGNDAQSSLIALCSGIISAIVWVLLASKVGLPSSTSHALIAGISGAAISINSNLSAINFDEWKKILFGLVISSVIGFFGRIHCNELSKKDL